MSSSEAIATSAPPPLPALYMVLSNKSSKQNLGTYLRTASAFGTTQVIVVGSLRFGTHGSHRAHKYVDIVHFYKFDEAKAYLKSRGCDIIGVKQHASSSAAHQAPFRGSTAFVIDNEIPGLSDDQLAICDSLVHVPCHGAQAMALSLDTTVVTAIVLHNFTKWAKFPPRSMEETSTQGKFLLDAYPTFKKDEHKAAEREQQRIITNQELTYGVPSMFDADMADY